ncbi:MAG: protein-L-isoaspartate O-methyltransferase family protein [Gammaproteobacteria bacterium]
MAETAGNRPANAQNSFAGKIRNRQLLAAFARVERADFLDISLRPHAASNAALPIGHAQTTSQPLVIARMLEMMLNRKTPQNALEIGAGCGYQTALLSLLCRQVVAVERIGALARQTAARLRRMGYNNAHVVHADGFSGYPKAAPYDGIVVCAEHAAVPETLAAQLAPEGRMIMPLCGGNGARLVAVNAEGKIVARREPVRFVPLRGGKN